MKIEQPQKTEPRALGSFIVLFHEDACSSVNYFRTFFGFELCY